MYLVKKLIVYTSLLFALFLLGFMWYVSSDRELPESLKKEALLAQQKHKKQIKKKGQIIIIDYHKPVFAKRLWLYDCEKDSVVLHAHVAHARKSGLIYARNFSNVPESRISSKGALVTQEDYHGSFGYSMRVGGLENENNNVRRRAIVFHPLVSVKLGSFRLPESLSFYSWGCFSMNKQLLTPLITQTKKGTLVYVRG